jgi:hypothetical protein
MSGPDRTAHGQLGYSTAELLATGAIDAPLVAGGRRCHGGFDAGGNYVSPRTKHRAPAIRAWQANHRAQTGREILDAPIDTWPESYPNVAQAKYLIAEGVREPMITQLTRIGTVEGFGAMIRHAHVGDLQRFFDDSIAGTALAHLDTGLFEAHARDEAGFEDEAGHRDMWFAARDVAFESPLTEDQTALMLERMGIPASPPTAEQIAAAQLAFRIHDDLDPAFESMIRRMLGILFIEISAFHTFAWAEEVLSDTALVAGDGEAARIVSYVRADETPHVEYLKTALTEIRDRTLVGESGRRLDGAAVISRLWDLALAESLGVRRDAFLQTVLGELEHSLAGHRRRDEILEGFHALGSIRPAPDGEFHTAATY